MRFLTGADPAEIFERWQQNKDVLKDRWGLDRHGRRGEIGQMARGKREKSRLATICVAVVAADCCWSGPSFRISRIHELLPPYPRSHWLL
jgi:hypothetical protein